MKWLLHFGQAVTVGASLYLAASLLEHHRYELELESQLSELQANCRASWDRQADLVRQLCGCAAGESWVVTRSSGDPTTRCRCTSR